MTLHSGRTLRTTTRRRIRCGHGPSGGSSSQSGTNLRASPASSARPGACGGRSWTRPARRVPLLRAVRRLVATDDAVAALLLGLGAAVVGCAGAVDGIEPVGPARRPGPGGGRRPPPGRDHRRGDGPGARPRRRAAGRGPPADRAGHRGGPRPSGGGRAGHAGPARHQRRHPAGAAAPGCAAAALAAPGARADGPIPRRPTRADGPQQLRTGRAGRRPGASAAVAGTGRAGAAGSSPARRARAGPRPTGHPPAREARWPPSTAAPAARTRP